MATAETTSKSTATTDQAVERAPAYVEFDKSNGNLSMPGFRRNLSAVVERDPDAIKALKKALIKKGDDTDTVALSRARSKAWSLAADLLAFLAKTDPKSGMADPNAINVAKGAY